MSQNEEKQWTTVAKFTTPTEAELARSFLDAHGIKAILRDQHTIALNLFYSNALGGVRLDVSTEQSKEARELLRGIDSNFYLIKEGELSAGFPCPSCKSEKTEVVTQTSRGWATLILTLIYIPLPFLAKDDWQCLSCGYTWRQS